MGSIALEVLVILYFRFWIYILFGYFKKKLEYCDPTVLSFRVLPTDCASNTMNNARFNSFMDIAQHENNVRTRFINVAVKENWRIVIRNSRITFLKPIKMFETFQVTTQTVGWDERYFYWKNEFINRKGEVAGRAYTGVAIRNRKERTAVRPAEILAKYAPNLKALMSADELKICSDVS